LPKGERSVSTKKRRPDDFELMWGAEEELPIRRARKKVVQERAKKPIQKQGGGVEDDSSRGEKEKILDCYRSALEGVGGGFLTFSRWEGEGEGSSWNEVGDRGDPGVEEEKREDFGSGSSGKCHI